MALISSEGEDNILANIVDRVAETTLSIPDWRTVETGKDTYDVLQTITILHYDVEADRQVIPVTTGTITIFT